MQDPADPDRPVSLIVTDNDNPIGRVLADTYRSDLEAAGIGTGRHAFYFTYPVSLSPLERHVIRVRRETTGEYVGRAGATLEPAKPSGAPAQAQPRGTLGNIDHLDRERIEGWARDSVDSDRPVSLILTDNDELIGRVLANGYRPDLDAAGIGTGYHAFCFIYPVVLSPFERHVIRIRHELTGGDIGQSPIALEPVKAFDETAQSAVADFLARFASEEDTTRKIDFLALEIERLLQQNADRDSLRVHRKRYRHYQERWRRRLVKSDDAGGQVVATNPRFRALVVDDRMPMVDRDAGSNAILSHIRSLQRLGFEVTFVPAMEFSANAAGIEILEAIGVVCCRAPYYGSVEELMWRQAGEFDVIYLHRVSNAAKYSELARQHYPKARLIYSVADLHHLRIKRQVAAEDRIELAALAERTRFLEFASAVTADAVITHSPVEAEILKKHVRGANIHVVAWSTTRQPTKVPFASRRDVAFIGGYRHQPNLDAARWLIAEIMPLVREHDQTIRCLLVGSDMPDDVRRLCNEHVVAVGHVEDLGNIFDKVRLTVAPLSYGAGIKGKVIESLAAGVPCVCTSVAAEGLALPEKLKNCMADDAKAIAAAIVEFHSERSVNEECGRSGVAYVAAECSEKRLDALMRVVIGPKHVPSTGS